MKVFIDVGANDGRSVAQFRTIFEDHEEYTIYCFEPEVERARQIELWPNQGLVIPWAAWDHDGMIDFYSGPSTLGSSCFGDKITGDVSGAPIKVPAFDLEKFVAMNFKSTSPRDSVVLKLNAEGAEYPILEKMIVNRTLALVDRLFVCWHQHKIPSIDEARHNGLVAAIAAAGVEVEDFWGR